MFRAGLSDGVRDAPYNQTGGYFPTVTGEQTVFLTRIGGFALRRIPVGTTSRSSALAVVSSDICSLAAHDRTHPYHSNRRADIYSLRVANRGMVILHWQTPSRPGPHPHRSAHASFGPHLTFIRQLITGLFIT